MKLSIVIPVYNVQNYINHCIESCINQDIPEMHYEIILVNDGSEDDSVAIAEEYAGKHKNIKILHQENKGHSAARNTGQKAAKGEYVWHLDSDDWIKENCLGRILEIINTNKPDAISVNYAKVLENEHDKLIPGKNSYEENKIYSGKEFFEIRDGNFVNVWRYVMRREFLMENALYCHEGFVHEGNEFTPRMLYFAENVMAIKEVYIFHRVREGSIMRTLQPQKVHSVMNVIKSLAYFRDTVVSDQKYFTSLNNFLLQFISNYLQHRNNYKIGDNWDLKSIKTTKPIRIEKRMTIKKKIKTILINFFPGKYKLLARF